MKNFLAVDTSGSYLTAIAYKDGQAYSVFLPDCAMKHSVSVMPAVDEVLKKANMRLDECDFFASVVGAGSFTGIRIGISVVKGFCLAYGKPALGVTSFDALAYNALDEGLKGKRLCLIDALHGCYYACGYDGEDMVYPPAYLTEEEVLALADQGYALCAYGALPLQEKTQVFSADPCKGLVRAVLSLAEQDRFGALEALYVRKSSAELNAGK